MDLVKSLQGLAIDKLTDEEKQFIVDISNDWVTIARPSQRIPEGDWTTWLILAGRGWGKTRVNSETVIRWAYEKPNTVINIVGATAADARDILILGESGILKCSQKGFTPHYEPSKRRLTWPNGSYALIFSADEPDRLRGVQCHYAAADELASWRYPEAYDQLMFGLRLGDKPRLIVTTTPRPTKLIRELAKDRTTHITTGTTYENRSNLAGAFFHHILTQYEGTRLGRQEINAEILEDIEGALWTSKLIESTRVTKYPDLKRIVVAIDPAATSKKDSDKSGIVVVGKGINGHNYVLDDKSGIYTPNEWARVVIGLYERYQADRVVGEINNGGEMIEAVLRNAAPNIAYKSVHATRGKALRAEPVVSLYEQNKMHHVGLFADLEEEMTGWAPDLGLSSPDRMDALVWAATELMGKVSFTLI